MYRAGVRNRNGERKREEYERGRVQKEYTREKAFNMVQGTYCGSSWAKHTLCLS